MTWTTPAGARNNFYHKVLQQPHTLIAGATGSGKSTIINGLIYTTLYESPKDVGLVLCDPKRVELAQYAKLPHVLRYAETIPEILAALQCASAIMDRRFETMKRRLERETLEKHIYVIIDEYADLMLNCKPSELKVMQHIAELGRAAHVHLILATQAPSRQVIKANIAVNMTAKIALRCDTAIESRQIINQPGAEKLPQYGDCLFKAPGEGVRHYTGICKIPDDELTARVQWWTQQSKGFLRWFWQRERRITP